MGLKLGIVKVVDYDPDRIKEFEQTKPIIDIAVGVKRLYDFTKYLQAL